MLMIAEQELFQKFLNDKEAGEFYITGVAGTGKTTCMRELLQHCIDNNISAIACAYTHKACGVLRQKLPIATPICTLHSFLKKRPTVNDRAIEVKNVDTNIQAGILDKVSLLFIDEFSMVGEKDFVSIAEIQFDDNGLLQTKVVYVGDPNQLPPVKDAKAVYPKEPYWIKLNKIYRQANDNPLIDTLIALNEYINGEEPKLLLEHDNFKRDCDIIKLYKNCPTTKIILAYTNATVESLNATIQDRLEPLMNDLVYSPTLRKTYTLIDESLTADIITNIRGEEILLGSKYKTLETLHELDKVKFYTVSDIGEDIKEEDRITVRAAVFGHDSYLQAQQELARKAVVINANIKKKYNVDDPTAWARSNWSNDLAKQRAKAWKHYLSFKDNVICLDFNHAMTVHKSQGSTYENVYLDIKDMSKCAKHDYTMYLKLLYVAISRASHNVFTN